ncbi:MAG: hypothetical protein R3B70_35090 [Polyangiaceae bacterium]
MTPDTVDRQQWLWGWDPTPGIVSVWAEPDGRALVWRRLSGALVCEDVEPKGRVLLASLTDLRHLGPRLVREGHGAGALDVTYQELTGEGELRYLVRAHDGRSLARAVLRGAERRLGRALRSVRELGPGAALVLPPEEQYPVSSGRTYFRGPPSTICGARRSIWRRQGSIRAQTVSSSWRSATRRGGRG